MKGSELTNGVFKTADERTTARPLRTNARLRSGLSATADGHVGQRFSLRRGEAADQRDFASQRVRLQSFSRGVVSDGEHLRTSGGPVCLRATGQSGDAVGQHDLRFDEPGNGERRPVIRLGGHRDHIEWSGGGMFSASATFQKKSELAECLFREVLAYSRHETRITRVRSACHISRSVVAPGSFVPGG